MEPWKDSFRAWHSFTTKFGPSPNGSGSLRVKVNRRVSLVRVLRKEKMEVRVKGLRVRKATRAVLLARMAKARVPPLQPLVFTVANLAILSVIAGN